MGIVQVGLDFRLPIAEIVQVGLTSKGDAI